MPTLEDRVSSCHKNVANDAENCGHQKIVSQGLLMKFQCVVIPPLGFKWSIYGTEFLNYIITLLRPSAGQLAINE